MEDGRGDNDRCCGDARRPDGASKLANYTLYEIQGQTHLSNAAYAVNSYNMVAGSANFTSNAQDYTAMIGGPNTSTSYYNMPNGWDTFQLNSLNGNLDAVGFAWLGFHPTAMYFKPGQPAANMQAGLTYTYESEGTSINHQGTALGFYHREDPQGLRFHMFRWDPASQSRTGDWPNLLAGGINENGLMVAQNLVPTNYYQLLELAIVPQSGNPTMITAPGYFTYMQPAAVSTYGGITVVGDMNSYIENDSNSFANGFVYNQQANVWNVLPGIVNQYFETHGLAVDVWGTKAAGYTVDASSNQTATVWENDGGTWNPTAVSSLVPNDPLWVYQQATGISPEGAISGIGMHKEHFFWVQRAFVLVPANLFNIGAFEGGIRGGIIVNPVLQMNAMDPFPIDFNLASDSRLVSVPAGIRMAAMSSRANFQMQTQGVDENTTVGVAASLGGVNVVREYLLLPAVLQALTMSANSDGVETGMVSFNGSGGPGGIQVSLTSSVQGVTVPSMVKVAKGDNSASFRIGIARTVPHGTPVTITATSRGVTMTQTFPTP